VTPTEVHLLVGFLIKASSPDAVDIELGSMLHDEAADEDRDVDITLRSGASWRGPWSSTVGTTGTRSESSTRPPARCSTSATNR